MNSLALRCPGKVMLKDCGTGSREVPLSPVPIWTGWSRCDTTPECRSVRITPESLRTWQRIQSTEKPHLWALNECQFWGDSSSWVIFMGLTTTQRPGVIGKAWKTQPDFSKTHGKPLLWHWCQINIQPYLKYTSWKPKNVLDHTRGGRRICAARGWCGERSHPPNNLLMAMVQERHVKQGEKSSTGIYQYMLVIVITGFPVGISRLVLLPWSSLWFRDNPCIRRKKTLLLFFFFLKLTEIFRLYPWFMVCPALSLEDRKYLSKGNLMVKIQDADKRSPRYHI